MVDVVVEIVEVDVVDVDVVDVEVVVQLALATHLDSVEHSAGLHVLVCHIWFAAQPSPPQN